MWTKFISNRGQRLLALHWSSPKLLRPKLGNIISFNILSHRCFRIVMSCFDKALTCRCNCWCFPSNVPHVGKRRKTETIYLLLVAWVFFFLSALWKNERKRQKQTSWQSFFLDVRCTLKRKKKHFDCCFSLLLEKNCYSFSSSSFSQSFSWFFFVSIYCAPLRWVSVVRITKSKEENKLCDISLLWQEIYRLSNYSPFPINFPTSSFYGFINYIPLYSWY